MFLVCVRNVGSFRLVCASAGFFLFSVLFYFSRIVLSL